MFPFQIILYCFSRIYDLAENVVNSTTTDRIRHTKSVKNPKKNQMFFKKTGELSNYLFASAADILMFNIFFRKVISGWRDAL